MPKATARTDIDFDLDDYDRTPRRRGVLTGLLARKPATSVGIGGAVILTSAILVNLLIMQDQRHAAPLFQTKLRAADLVPSHDAPPLPAPRPVELTAASSPAPAPAAAPVAKAAVVQPVRAESAGDPIAREIARGETTARIEKPKVDAKRQDPIAGLMRSVGAAAPQSPEPNASSILAAQRALMKLGFVVRPDGVFGETTRQAIERFERDKGMPVHGSLTPKVMRELARLSGVEAQ